MQHKSIEQVMQRAESSKEDSDFTYFFSLLLAGEALVKTLTLGIVAAIENEKNRNRYRLEHQLVRADGLGDWVTALDDALTGPASQYLSVEARIEQREFTFKSKNTEWQHEATAEIKKTLDCLKISSEEVPTKTDLKRWFRLFVLLRNKTRGHGATQPTQTTKAVSHLRKSLNLIISNTSILKRPWANLHRNLNGKYWVSHITEDPDNLFGYLKSRNDVSLNNGIYICYGEPRRINLIETESELYDFYYANGNLTSKRFELISYFTDNKKEGDGSLFLTPPGQLPQSETEGSGELGLLGRCFSNAPEAITDYIDRPRIEKEVRTLLLDDKRPIVTFLGRGGIGKTSLALKVINDISSEHRFDAIVWLSARDIDLQLSGPKPVRPHTLSPDEVSKYYVKLTQPCEAVQNKSFKPRDYFEKQLQHSELGPCLFVFDNFETTQNPAEMFAWIDSFLRLPNKALITTRLREFKGDYPVEVGGMEEKEAQLLVAKTAKGLGISDLIDTRYASELISKSEGHPYVIKILLGEVAKKRQATSIPHILAASDDILTALFERTFVELSPCSQRAFLTLAAWNSQVPRLALEAVLFRSTHERHEVEKGVEALLQYSLAESNKAGDDQQDFINVPLVASIFGKKKLNISPSKAAIQSDAEILQMLGPTSRDDKSLGLIKKLETFISNIAKRIDQGEDYGRYKDILETVCRTYNPGWLLLAKWHIEQRTCEGYETAKLELRRFLENDPDSKISAEAWRMLGNASFHTGDKLGEVHSYIERSQIIEVPFYDLSNTANSLNQMLRISGIDLEIETKRDLATRLIQIMSSRQSEASADDLSRMAWLAIHSGQEALARGFVECGLKLEPTNYHIQKLANNFGISL